MKSLISIVSYGNIEFLELALRGIQETLTTPNTDILVVIAKPGDSQMRKFLDERSIPYIQNEINKGFPGSINDAYDFAFVDGDYDAIFSMGNDVVPMPGCLDTMLSQAQSTDWDIYCASEFDSRFLVAQYPEARQFFHGDDLVFSDFQSRPWEFHGDYRENTIQPDTLKDVRNLTLYKRRAFEVVGFDDPNFFPNGYFADLDYARRCHLLGLKACGLPAAAFFHFWSRTIKQGENRPNGKFFNRNGDYYEAKWGTRTWEEEKFSLPFDGKPYQLPGSTIVLPSSLDIPDRGKEPQIIDYWSSLK